MQKEKFGCDQCPRVYVLQSLLRDHVLYAHEGVKFSCDQCENFTGSKLSVKRHKRTVHEERFKCDQCDYRGSSLKYLKEHTENKHLGIRHNCDQCGDSFAYLHLLRHHIKETHEEKTLLCDKCDFSTNENYLLRRHIEAVHLKKFSCLECDMVLCRPANLRIHIESKHPHGTQIKSLPKKSFKMYMCDKCPFKTTWSKWLKERIYIYTYLCD